MFSTCNIQTKNKHASGKDTRCGGIGHIPWIPSAFELYLQTRFLRDTPKHTQSNVQLQAAIAEKSLKCHEML